MTREDLEEQYLDFEAWLAQMPAALSQFLARVPDETRRRLNYSPESLDALESWMLGRYPDTKSVLEEAEKEVLDGIARYVGETYIKELGGGWDITFEDPKYVYHGLPQIPGFGGSRDSPHRLATSAIARRTGVFLRSILSNIKRSVGETRVPN
jgi:hypothetical protein